MWWMIAIRAGAIQLDMEAGHGPLEDALQLRNGRMRRPPGYYNGRLLGTMRVGRNERPMTSS
jgi:hypothetical protein